MSNIYKKINKRVRKGSVNMNDMFTLPSFA